MFNNFLLIASLFFSNESQKAKKFDEITGLPHAKQLITDQFKARKLNSYDVEFELINETSSSMSMYHYRNIIKTKEDSFEAKFFFGIREKDLKILDAILDNRNEEFLHEDFPANLTHLEFKHAMQFMIGHELQHYCERVAEDRLHQESVTLFKKHWQQYSTFVPALFVALNKSHEEKIKEEIKADKCASLNPNILRAGAKFFQGKYNESKKFYDDFYEHKIFSKEDEHPHPLYRAKYLLEAAHAQEVINQKFNAAVHCIRKKQQREKQINEVLDATQKMTL